MGELFMVLYRAAMGGLTTPLHLAVDVPAAYIDADYALFLFVFPVPLIVCRTETAPSGTLLLLRLS
jgi:hypothetical protein